MNADTTQIIRELELGFNLEKGSLTPKQISNTHLVPNPNLSKSLQRRSRSQSGLAANKNGSKPLFDHARSTTFAASSAAQNEAALEEKKQKERKRSMSVMNIKPIKPIIPSMNTKEYLQFLLERAVTNKAWNDSDAERLCKCAVSMKCDWITVHSMWVRKCNELLLKYTVKQVKNDQTQSCV
jgi:hypothetical protein